jgi:hypothetical protein
MACPAGKPIQKPAGDFFFFFSLPASSVKCTRKQSFHEALSASKCSYNGLKTNRICKTTDSNFKTSTEEPPATHLHESVSPLHEFRMVTF